MLINGHADTYPNIDVIGDVDTNESRLSLLSCARDIYNTKHDGCRLPSEHDAGVLKVLLRRSAGTSHPIREPNFPHPLRKGRPEVEVFPNNSMNKIIR